MPDDQQECCIVGVCCGGHHDLKAKAALSRALQAEAKLGDGEADRAASWVLDTFDLAPKNTLKAYRDRVAELAREYEYEG